MARLGRPSPVRSTVPTRSSQTPSRWRRCPPTTATPAPSVAAGAWASPANLPQEQKDCAFHILTYITSKELREAPGPELPDRPQPHLDRRRTRRSSRRCRTSPAAVDAIESAQILEIANIPETFEIVGRGRPGDQPRADRREGCRDRDGGRAGRRDRHPRARRPPGGVAHRRLADLHATARCPRTMTWRRALGPPPRRLMVAETGHESGAGDDDGALRREAATHCTSDATSAAGLAGRRSTCSSSRCSRCSTAWPSRSSAGTRSSRRSTSSAWATTRSSSPTRSSGRPPSTPRSSSSPA